MFRDIVVAIDGSRTATVELDDATEPARSESARPVVLISVATSPGRQHPPAQDLARAARQVVGRPEALVRPGVCVEHAP